MQSDKDIEALETLRVSYERVNVPKFISSLEQITRDGDPFTKKHLDNIVRDFHRKAIKELIKAYRRVRIDFLAQVDTFQLVELIYECVHSPLDLICTCWLCLFVFLRARQTLRISNTQVESLLIQLVLDNEIVGRVDQVKGLLDLTEK